MPTPQQRIEAALIHAAHYLPAQGPITVFVHHNPLHVFEGLPFDRAVLEAGQIFGCEPYLSEERYRREMSQGRITLDDLRQVLTEDLTQDGAGLIGGLVGRHELRLALLAHPVVCPGPQELAWHLGETDALAALRPDLPFEARQRLLGRTRRMLGRDLPEARLERTLLAQLWQAARTATAALPPAPIAAVPAPVRPRDWLLAASGADSDTLVHPVLIRLCAAFLDQGVADWQMPDREHGFHRACLALHATGTPGPAPWLGRFQALAAAELAAGTGEIDSIAASLAALGIAEVGWEPFITASLLALRGWAGMVRQLELRPDRAPVHAPPVRLTGFLAVRLLLERAALAALAEERLGHRGPLAGLAAGAAGGDQPAAGTAADHPASEWTGGATGEVAAPAQHARPAAPPGEPPSPLQRAFLLFQLAQLLGRDGEEIAALPTEAVAALLAECDAFDALSRRRLLHQAYERRYRTETLDAVAAHNRLPAAGQPTPRFQVVFCLDEREESLRRHLEEVAPDGETLATPGFFGVAMYYRAVAEEHAVPLCPIALRPEHEVEEVSGDPTLLGAVRKRSGAAVSRLGHRLRAGSRTLTHGTILAATLGALAALPLVFRVLFPRLTARLRRATERLAQPDSTRLALERRPAVVPRLGRWSGFSCEEMSALVHRLCDDLGLHGRLARCVILMGHGSSSRNNPHESAYNCGACGGGAGGPNARALAQMANHPEVRRALAAAGTPIPDTTWFAGAQHDTCSDAITYFDTDLVPDRCRAAFERARSALERARTSNAHERSRRFELAPTWFPPALALAHVEGRSEDLAQPRPEAGHATNATCIIGRRQRTRGLFLDRRAFLTSYDPTLDDDDASTLAALLGAVIPVVAGINLEYYFSAIDQRGYGSGTKLPHNITSLLGVMDGHASDLRTGLPWQMVDIHEPMRLLCIVEARPLQLERALARQPAVARLFDNGWLQLASLDPGSAAIHVRGPGGFSLHQSESRSLPVAPSSIAWYGGRRAHLPCAHISVPPPHGAPR
jgi:hypothetical protein